MLFQTFLKLSQRVYAAAAIGATSHLKLGCFPVALLYYPLFNTKAFRKVEISRSYAEKPLVTTRLAC